jgi:hypothetical protein
MELVKLPVEVLPFVATVPKPGAIEQDEAFADDQANVELAL